MGGSSVRVALFKARLMSAPAALMAMFSVMALLVPPSLNAVAVSVVVPVASGVPESVPLTVSSFSHDSSAVPDAGLKA